MDEVAWTMLADLSILFFPYVKDLFALSAGLIALVYGTVTVF